MHEVLGIILGGGKGTRLYPLTKERSKPAVPLAGKYRLIDIPISNCLNSDISRIFVLTQYLSQSLNHHISLSYRFDSFRKRGFVTNLSAEQTQNKIDDDWYLGTADAVRKTLRHCDRYRFKEFLILSGDHIYRMDYKKMIYEHRERRADVTIAALDVGKEEISGLGVMDVDDFGKVNRFVEKPTNPEVIKSLELSEKYYQHRNDEVKKDRFMANMGVYVFNREVMEELLFADKAEDFGKHVLPAAIKGGKKVYSHLFDGYWEDIGTIKAFFNANLAFADVVPKFSFYDELDKIYTRARHLPPIKINNAKVEQTLLSEGCIIEGADINYVTIGVRSIIKENTTIRTSILMGADYYENEEESEATRVAGLPPIGIGKNCFIENTIIDKNARIGDNVTLVGGNGKDIDTGMNWSLRDGILVIHKDAIIPNGTKLVFK
jgi:glucose-1-phosphate adenylyltransferase